MEAALPRIDETDQRIARTAREMRARLRNFIRRRVANEDDVEDILQEVFYELVEAYRLVKPVEEVGAWLFRVARNRIIDRFRRTRNEVASPVRVADSEADDIEWEDLLPSMDPGPDAAYARSVLIEELDGALEELPMEQREVFIAHEIEGRSFKDMASETGVSVNTLLSRKHYAVVHLRQRLQALYSDWS